jgi:hypothetical protein
MGINQQNINKFGIMTAAAIFNTVTGLILGFIVLKLTNPPVGFRYSAILATAMGNNGDLPLAIILSLGNSYPFQQGDAAVVSFSHFDYFSSKLIAESYFNVGCGLRFCVPCFYKSILLFRWI